MGILVQNESQMQDLVRALGVEPEANFLYARHHNGAGKAFALDLLGPSATAASEPAFLLVFTPAEIIAQRLSNQRVHRYARAAMTNFKVRDGAQNSVVIDFDHAGEHVSFYADMGASMRLQYVADNLAALMANHFLGYATDMSQVGQTGLASFKYPLLESLLPLALVIAMMVLKADHFGRYLAISGLILVLIWLPKIPRPHRR